MRREERGSLSWETSTPVLLDTLLPLWVFGLARSPGIGLSEHCALSAWVPPTHFTCLGPCLCALSAGRCPRVP